jgi:hypothetical protein
LSTEEPCIISNFEHAQENIIYKEIKFETTTRFNTYISCDLSDKEKFSIANQDCVSINLIQTMNQVSLSYTEV